MRTENNCTLESLLVASAKFIDAKRQEFPRFYNLNNQEVLTLLGMTSFKVFCTHLAEMFMHVLSFDSHVQDFSAIKILGMSGRGGDALIFAPDVNCVGAVSLWLGTMVDRMQQTIRDQLEQSIQHYSSLSLNDWVMTVTSYSASLTLHIKFTRDIEMCFSAITTATNVFS
jgi:hypothetical protein